MLQFPGGTVRLQSPLSPATPSDGAVPMGVLSSLEDPAPFTTQSPGVKPFTERSSHTKDGTLKDMKPDVLNCLVCGIQVSQAPGKGRTRTYCSREHKDLARARRRRLQRHGLAKLILAPGYTCPICGTLVTEESGYIDHDHTCCSGRERNCGLCTRAVLCVTCNLGILGTSKDNIDVLLSAVNYLRKWNEIIRLRKTGRPDR